MSLLLLLSQVVSETVITCTPGTVDAAGVNSNLNKRLNCQSGDTAVSGINSFVNNVVMLSTVPGDNLATGVTSLLNISIKSSYGDLSALGINSNLSYKISTSKGDVSVAGVDYTLGVLISCNVGDSDNVGVNCGIKLYNIVNPSILRSYSVGIEQRYSLIFGDKPTYICQTENRNLSIGIEQRSSSVPSEIRNSVI